MDAEKVQAWAREARNLAYAELARSMPNDVPDLAGRYMQLTDAHFARLVRAAAFDEAAKVCESWGEAHVKKWDAIGNDQMRDDAKSRAWDAIQHAARIRALAAAEKEPK